MYLKRSTLYHLFLLNVKCSSYYFQNILISDETFFQLDNSALYEGDIKLDPIARLYMEVDRNLPPRRKRAVARDRRKRWIGGVIPYTIDRKLRKSIDFTSIDC